MASRGSVASRGCIDMCTADATAADVGTAMLLFCSQCSCCCRLQPIVNVSCCQSVTALTLPAHPAQYPAPRLPRHCSSHRPMLLQPMMLLLLPLPINVKHPPTKLLHLCTQHRIPLPRLPRHCNNTCMKRRCYVAGWLRLKFAACLFRRLFIRAYVRRAGPDYLEILKATFLNLRTFCVEVGVRVWPLRGEEAGNRKRGSRSQVGNWTPWASIPSCRPTYAWASADVFEGGANFFKFLELAMMTNEGVEAPVCAN